MIQIKSYLKDGRIDAYNALVEITVAQYLEFAKDIIDNNEFQRKKVIKSKIKEILQEDLLRNCLVPSIVLAVTTTEVENIKSLEEIKLSETIIDNAIKSRDILVIDGLQRTFTLLGLEETLLQNIENQKLPENKVLLQKQLDDLHKHTIRAEIYLGINRVGLLYRMITLNTGQTTMSTRHLMEILYADYARTGIDKVKFIRDKDEAKISLNTEEFNFKTILDGFNSYLEGKEALIERVEILDNIKSLDIVKREESNKNLFNDFVLTYKLFLDTIQAIAPKWKYDPKQIDGEALKIKSSPFGNSVLDIFKKSQVLTGFGAALGHLKNTYGLDLKTIEKSFKDISFEDDDAPLAFALLIKHLDLVKEKSKKIGNDQRYYFKYFFRALLNPDSDQHMNFNKASDYAFDITRDEKLK